MELPVEESHWCNRHEMSYVSLSTIKIGVVLLAANSPASERYSEQNPTTWSTKVAEKLEGTDKLHN
jgi:hypothetical protein